MTTTLFSEAKASEPAPSAEEQLIQITPFAAGKVQEIRGSEGIEQEMVLRLAVIGGCSGFSYDLYFDEPTPRDREYTINGVEVAVDEMSLMYLVGTEVDYIEQLGGAGFKFHNPNVKATCGCGSSFAM